MKSIRKAVRVFVFNDKDEVLAINYNLGNPGYYDLPGGKIEEIETSNDAAIREVKEETGLDLKLFDYVGKVFIDYPERMFDFDVYVGIKYDGVPQNFEENNSMWIDRNKLISNPKIFPIIELLKSEYNDYFKNKNLNIKIIANEVHSIIEVKDLNEKSN